MKVVIVLVLVLLVGLLVFRFAATSTESFDPAAQGLETRAKIQRGDTWTDVLEKAGDPSRWRAGTSSFDFNYIDKYEADTRDVIARGIENGEFGLGFSFLYRFGTEVTFAVNFDGTGNFMNIQDKVNPKELAEELGG
jgi:hypothetical protein